jgi:hypothetical protein
VPAPTPVVNAMAAAEKVADDVESTLRFVDVDELDGRAEYRSGIGYVHPVEAAAEILDELLQPYLDDLAEALTDWELLFRHGQEM